MGRFYLHNGDVRPSDSYLANHDLDYDSDDWFNDDYDVEDDVEVLYETRTCNRCGCSFTLYEAMSRYSDRIGYQRYGYDFVGEYCGDCAADITEGQ